MLLSRGEIREDKCFDLLTEAILERDQPRTTDLFYRMVARDGRSVGDALSVVTAAEAPFVQVPSHINVRDGQIVLINNDHTILGLRASAYLMPYLPEKYRLLPLLQSVWYIPAGLDIWNQLLGKYPGRYATMKGITVPPPSYGPVVWHEDLEPIRETATVEERLYQHMIATVSGDSRRSYGLFLGLAEDQAVRPKLADQLQYLGLIDLQDTVIGRKARNTGHKAIRARSIIDLANFVGWDRSHGVYYMGIPDMAIGPLYYSLYDAVCVRIASEFADGGVNLKQTNQTLLSPAEVEDMVRQLMAADADTVWGLLTSHLTNGKSIKSLDEAIMALDFPRATALANAYLRSPADRKAYQAVVALAACRFQDDPHNQKITISTFEEYAHNSTHLRDRLLLATVRLLAGWVKMPSTRDCFARFEKDWVHH